MAEPTAPADAGPERNGDAHTRPAVWTRYWASGASHSFGGGADGRYQGPIAEHWLGQFGLLRAGQRMLDLATGNAALPRLLLDARPELDVQVEAVDIATIDPAWTATLAPQVRQRLRLHSGTQIEALPFADETFHLVTSQYGIEYADLARAIPETLRVTAPGGHIALLVHVADARPVALAHKELPHLDWLLGPDGLLDATAELLEPLARSTTPEGRAALSADPQATRIRERFNAAQDTVRHRAEASGDGSDVLFEIRAVVGESVSLAAHGDLQAASQHLRGARRAAEDARLRLQQLCRHALSRDLLGQMQGALRLATDNGHVEVREIRERGHLMGCALSARKASR